MNDLPKPKCFSTKIDIALADFLHKELASQGFAFSKPPYTLFSARKKGVSCTLYSSGALTVQGSEMKEFMEFFIEPIILKNVSYSYPHKDVNFASHIGVDEAGKGDFFGPLCIGALYADKAGIESLLSMGVKDSKRLSDTKVKELAEKIKKTFCYSLVLLFPEKYNELYNKFHNLNSLLAWGHATAIAETVTKSSCHTVLIDQFAHESVVKRAVAQKKIEIDLFQEHKGENDPVVAGASILARAAFLDGMDRLSQEWHIQLPKGASSIVIEVGKTLASLHGPSIFSKVAKTHFKTLDEIVIP